ncbi:TatD family hydrolase [Rummeliibacillus suwonensis]|uniref:TatD family hydrolase n=1 Tax=Rummeliibacillus suwonensis TaxID=1306154 RepID=UPI001AAED24A|nr:TatD family hydrolase [Rummeliibacillus suwonensis]MBO2537015.1 TatD family hydrolase [Rummeliibacillus suwonensis]
MVLIDTHVHIDFYSDPLSIALEYERLGIYTMFVTNLPEIFNKHLSSFSNFKFVRLCLGYHPQVSSEYKLNKKLFMKSIVSTQYIGEVGLDFQNVDKIIIKRQIEALKFITSEQFNKGRIYTVHSRGTEDEVLNILIENNVKHAIFHWYSGKVTTLEKIAEKGYYFSLNPRMLYTKNGQKIIQRIPKKSILFETDGPFARINRKIITPDTLPDIYCEFEKIIPNFEDTVFTNFRRLLFEKDYLS